MFVLIVVGIASPMGTSAGCVRCVGGVCVLNLKTYVVRVLFPDGVVRLRYVDAPSPILAHQIIEGYVMALYNYRCPNCGCIYERDYKMTRCRRCRKNNKLVEIKDEKSS